MKLYIVEALRLGNENHSYVVGVYEKKQNAIYAGEIEESWLDGKYEYRITEHELNEIDNDALMYHKLCLGA